MPLNLVQHRGQPNVWDQLSSRCEWDTERWLAAVASGLCFAAGLRRRSPAGLLLMLGGSSLAWWAASGIEERNQWREHARASIARPRRGSDVVAEASQESFPASDAPAWTPTTGNTATLEHPALRG